MSKKAIHIILIFVVIGINLFFGLPRVAKYTAVDETLWSYDRVPKFWRSVAKGNWRGTNLCDKPGIVLAMISGAGLPFIPDPGDYENLQFKSKTSEQLTTIDKIYYSLRLPVYLFTLASLFAFYFLLKRLLSEEIALLAVIFIGLSPILLGISLIVNTDAINWILMPLTLLSFLIYQKEENKKFLYLAGIILGLGILTKFISNLLFPFLLGLILIKYLSNDHTKNEDKINYFKNSMRDYILLVMIALLTIFIFYPSAWIKPKELLNTTIYSLALRKTWPLILGAIIAITADVFLLKSFLSRKISDFLSDYKTFFFRTVSLAATALVFFVLYNTYAGMKFYDFEAILSSPKSDMPLNIEFPLNFFSAFYSLVFGLTPLVLITFVVALIALVKMKRTEITNENPLIYAFSLLLFILAYYLGNSISGISSTVRYQIVNYPLAAIIAAIGLHSLINAKIAKKYFSGIKFYFLIIFILVISSVSLFQIKPLFLAYSSKLLPSKYTTNLKDMGDGAWETSQYLNTLPNANQLVIWSDKKQVCEKFVGRCKTGFNYKDLTNFKFDYIVASTGGMNETISRASQKNRLFQATIGNIDVLKLYSPTEFYDFKININDRKNDFIKVVNPSNILVD
jgi:4-amino-4-deoxy-L-arabinose transferase-like glycosyltransferase